MMDSLIKSIRGKLTRSILLLGLMAISGCASLISSQVGGLANNLSAAIYNNNDLESVGQAIPTFLILIDSLIVSSPDSETMLRAGAQLNDAYAGGFVSDAERKKKLTDKSLVYAKAALCANDDDFCELAELPYQDFLEQLANSDEGNIDYIYTLGVSWLSWIQAHSDDWSAITGLAKVEALLKRVVELDDSYDNGSAHLYLGGIATLLPQALGGKPEEGRKHFDKAIEYSGGKNLMAKVVYAQMYARLVFNQELHDSLLNEVLSADPNVKNFILMNTLAQREAKKLLASSPDYF
jgi:hypothetical protein|tara:strand:+ start:4781 stop:5662 length:882 start_codon:yes stop_codon:yes gene_type:complete